MATNRELMLAGEWYRADDPELVALAQRRHAIEARLNDPDPSCPTDGT